jgi:CheY-like chemotaxis protein
VDDDPSVLRLLGRALRDGGMMVDLLDCGQALVRMVVARQYDLILLDLALPDLDGAELLETLRSDHPDIQVMVVSAHDGLRAAGPLPRRRCDRLRRQALRPLRTPGPGPGAPASPAGSQPGGVRAQRRGHPGCAAPRGDPA